MIHLHKNWSRKEIESNFAKTCFYRQKSDSFFSVPSSLISFIFYFFFGSRNDVQFFYILCALLVVGTVKIKFGNIVLITSLNWMAGFIHDSRFIFGINSFLHSENKEWESHKKKVSFFVFRDYCSSCFTFVSCTTNDYSMSVMTR